MHSGIHVPQCSKVTSCSYLANQDDVSATSFSGHEQCRVARSRLKIQEGVIFVLCNNLFILSTFIHSLKRFNSFCTIYGQVMHSYNTYIVIGHNFCEKGKCLQNLIILHYFFAKDSKNSI